MTGFPLATAVLVVLSLVFASVCAADGTKAGTTTAPAELDPQLVFEEPCASPFERPAVCDAALPSAPPTRMSLTWTARELDLLRHERSEIRMVGTSFGVAFSVLGLVAGAWLLAAGVESAQGAVEDCSYDGSWCFSRSAPYAGTVLMGVSSVGLGRTAKRLRRRAQQRRHLSRQINELASRRTSLD